MGKTDFKYYRKSNAISVNETGEIIVVGDNGAVIVREDNVWKQLKTQSEFNLQGVCHFKDEIFICSDFEIYKFENNNLIPEDRYENNDFPKTTMNLFSGKDVLYSQGENDVFIYSENNWERKF